MKIYLIEYGDSHYIRPKRELVALKITAKFKFKKLIKNYRYVYVFECVKNSPIAYLLWEHEEGDSEWKA